MHSVIFYGGLPIPLVQELNAGTAAIGSRKCVPSNLNNTHRRARFNTSPELADTWLTEMQELNIFTVLVLCAAVTIIIRISWHFQAVNSS